MSAETYWHASKVSASDREHRNGHRAACLWFTGLSGSGKSTLAVELERKLYEKGVHAYLLDGDNVRQGLNRDLGFSDADRTENIRRIGEVARLFVDAGVVAITSFISPFKRDRAAARSLFEPGRFVEIYVDCDLETCRKRDPKGLYAKAAQGAIENFTGITSAYEAPLTPEVTIHNGSGAAISSGVEQLLAYLREMGITTARR